MDSKERVLRNIRGKEVDRPPAFSGMGNIISEGIEKFDYAFPEIFLDAEKMANVASTSPILFGYESVNLPIDQTMVAEAFGAEVDYHKQKEKNEIRYPTVKEKAVSNLEGFTSIESPPFEKAGRMPIVIEAIELLRGKVDESTPIGAWLMGPFASAGQLGDRKELLRATLKNSDAVHSILDEVTKLQIEYARKMEEAGADFLCLREPGASQDILMPSQFEKFAKPYLTKILDSIDAPKILHICGLTNDIIKMMWECNPDALSVEEKNNLVENRRELGDKPVLYGAVSPVETLLKGTSEKIKKRVEKCFEAGVDVPMPGDDVWPSTPKENMEMLVKATQSSSSRQREL
ncbi:hypothetical protein AKJ52_02910 [candidate division MSBL1 archaeon SCGC-AAA382C18]|uniref:Uroporphyrinogen decarboxylase (URO-D) domain-containing protein n=1 Tax=candidate division MSBL1 archaeon SCGC-AAA382C18 TaxID=1698281 RepID=A0A133VHF4_9EURY|nr:hypothetical protein AKJ52_02910 [candidate division MSBL1 archaeon SCGC-AAA382C18]